MRNIRPTPIAADAGAGVKPAPKPAAPDASSTSAAIDTAGTPAPAAPSASSTEAELVAVRVISGSHGHEVDDVLHLTADEAVEAERLAWGDASPAAVAEAQRLRSIGDGGERD